MCLPSLSLFGRVGSLTTPENICGYASALDVNKQTASSRVPVPSAQPQKASQTGHLTSRFQQVTLVLNIIINYPILSYPILSYPILSKPITSERKHLPVYTQLGVCRRTLRILEITGCDRTLESGVAADIYKIIS